jgi:RNA polymerase subunit RPABC4/transcription elongation factor Spt4
MFRRSAKNDASNASATPYDMVCPACGAEETVKLKSWPPPACSKCGKAQLAIAAVCPRCGKTAPMTDSRAYWENPYGATRSGKILPRCAQDKTVMLPKIVWRLQQEELRRVGAAKPNGK